VWCISSRSLHDALPIASSAGSWNGPGDRQPAGRAGPGAPLYSRQAGGEVGRTKGRYGGEAMGRGTMGRMAAWVLAMVVGLPVLADRKSTRLNSSHVKSS